MSKTGIRSSTKKTSSKLVKRPSKNLKITVLPIDPNDEPYTKTFNNRNNDNNLKLVWNKEELMKIYDGILPKSKTYNFSVYTK